MFNGLDGNDQIQGGQVNDALNGGSGDDTIYGNNGNDIITGGIGNDVLIGGFGADTYYFNAGDGADRIREADGTPGVIDKLFLGATLTPANTTLTKQGGLFTLSWGADSIVMENYMSDSNYQVEEIHFDDGTIWAAAELVAVAASWTHGVPYYLS